MAKTCKSAKRLLQKSMQKWGYIDYIYIPLLHLRRIDKKVGKKLLPGEIVND